MTTPEGHSPKEPDGRVNALLHAAYLPAKAIHEKYPGRTRRLQIGVHSLLAGDSSNGDAAFFKTVYPGDIRLPHQYEMKIQTRADEARKVKLHQTFFVDTDDKVKSYSGNIPKYFVDKIMTAYLTTDVEPVKGEISGQETYENLAKATTDELSLSGENDPTIVVKKLTDWQLVKELHDLKGRMGPKWPHTTIILPTMHDDQSLEQQPLTINAFKTITAQLSAQEITFITPVPQGTIRHEVVSVYEDLDGKSRIMQVNLSTRKTSQTSSGGDIQDREFWNFVQDEDLNEYTNTASEPDVQSEDVAIDEEAKDSEEPGITVFLQGLRAQLAVHEAAKTKIMQKGIQRLQELGDAV